MSATAFTNLVKVAVSGTPGTGAITLGAAVSPYFGAGELVDGETYAYSILDGSNVASGHGVYTASGTSLARDAAERCNVAGVVQSTPMSLTSAAVVLFTALAADLARYGEVDVAFDGERSREVTVADVNVRTTSRIMASIAGQPPAGTDADELEMDPLVAYGRCAVDGTLLIRVTSLAPIFGDHTVLYTIV